MPAVMTPPAKAGDQGKAKAPTPMVPFTRAAKEHIETFVDESVQIGAATQSRGPFDVPAYGFLRSIRLLCEATLGVASVTVAAQEDAPWIAIQEVALQDVNGANIVGPFSGYDLYLINKYGGYRWLADPKLQPSFSAVAVGASASGNFAFSLCIPVELNGRDALGALANQNASSTYKVRYTLNSSANIYSTAPNTTLPTVRTRMFLEAWTQPPAVDLRGIAQATTPPAHGTTGYWSKFTASIVSGQNTIRLPRVGNYVRAVIFTFRRTASTRANGEADFPDPAQTFWDTRLLHSYVKAVWRDVLHTRYGLTAAVETAGGRDNGVFPYEFCHEFDGHVGQELRDGWLPTVQSTRLEIVGSFANAGALDIITNDVAPAGEVFV